MSWMIPPALLFKATLWDLELAYIEGDEIKIAMYESLMDSYWHGMKQSERDAITAGTNRIIQERARGLGSRNE